MHWLVGPTPEKEKNPKYKIHFYCVQLFSSHGESVIITDKSASNKTMGSPRPICLVPPLLIMIISLNDIKGLY